VSEYLDALQAVQERQADDADAALLALLTADKTSLVVTSHDRCETSTYVDANGAAHQVQTVRP
jgi:hypothetical protein